MAVASRAGESTASMAASSAASGSRPRLSIVASSRKLAYRSAMRCSSTVLRLRSASAITRRSCAWVLVRSATKVPARAWLARSSVVFSQLPFT